MERPPEGEQRLRRLVAELRLMRDSAEALQRRLELLRTAAAELRVAESALKALKEVEEGTPILIPLGGGTYIDARLGALRRVIVGVGADVSVEMEPDRALEDLSGRLEEVERAAKAVEQQLEQLLMQMEIHQEGISRLAAELRGEAGVREA
ncbi:MAG: prefoldin subunit alpha [Candidatus Bathyarchaeota archaeon B23]|nr:MAG: prefoldin subunit alpha [Candidatus Bathyarchaeota archaeon B23]